MMKPEPTRAVEAVFWPFVLTVPVPAAGHLGVTEEECGGAHWVLEYFPERQCVCGAAL